MRHQPFGERGPSDCSGRNSKNVSLLLINRGIDLIAMKYKRHFHCSMTNSFITVQERMIFNQ